MLFDYIRSGMILNQDVTDERGKLLLESGAILTDIYLSRLKQLGFSQLRVCDPYGDSLKPPAAVPNDLRQELGLCFRALINMRWNQAHNVKLRYMYFKKIDATIKQIIAHLETQIPDMINLSVRQPTEDEYTHSVNVLHPISNYWATLKLPCHCAF